MNNRTLFMAEITDGFTFKNAVCMMKNEQDEITFLISKDKITITFLNKGEHAIHDIILYTKDFHDYSYNITNREEYPITVNTLDLYIATKPIGKKDSLKISWKEGLEKLSIQPIKSSKESGHTSVSFINIIHKEYIKYEFINYYNPEDSCIKMLNRQFSSICSQAASQKCKYMEITACSNKIIFKGVLIDGTHGMISQYASNKYDEDKITKVYTGKGQLELNIIDTEEINIKLPLNTIKTLSKIHNIVPSGTELKLYFSTGKPVKIESRIGCIGNYDIYLRDYKIIK